MRRLVNGESVRAWANVGPIGDGFYGDISGTVIGATGSGRYYAIKLDNPIPGFDYDSVIVEVPYIRRSNVLERIAAST